VLQGIQPCSGDLSPGAEGLASSLQLAPLQAPQDAPLSSSSLAAMSAPVTVDVNQPLCVFNQEWGEGTDLLNSLQPFYLSNVSC
jgi:hypothetical protein